jgi:hypothetical protein
VTLVSRVQLCGGGCKQQGNSPRTPRLLRWLRYPHGCLRSPRALDSGGSLRSSSACGALRSLRRPPSSRPLAFRETRFARLSTFASLRSAHLRVRQDRRFVSQNCEPLTSPAACSAHSVARFGPHALRGSRRPPGCSRHEAAHGFAVRSGDGVPRCSRKAAADRQRAPVRLTEISTWVAKAARHEQLIRLRAGCLRPSRGHVLVPTATPAPDLRRHPQRRSRGARSGRPVRSRPAGCRRR